MRRIMSLAMAAIFLSVALATAEELKPKQPGKKDKCPVCGMFVHKYPDWVGQIAFKDGGHFFFDGAKDLFKYYFNLGKYNPGKSAADIAAIWVTDYYDMAPIDARAAVYVVGSNVFGPMGRELIPFKTPEAAGEFKKDHGGTRSLTFDQVIPAVIEKLD